MYVCTHKYLSITSSRFSIYVWRFDQKKVAGADGLVSQKIKAWPGIWITNRLSKVFFQQTINFSTPSPLSIRYTKNLKIGCERWDLIGCGSENQNNLSKQDKKSPCVWLIMSNWLFWTVRVFENRLLEIEKLVQNDVNSHTSPDQLRQWFH